MLVFRNRHRALGKEKYASPDKEEIEKFNDHFKSEMANKVDGESVYDEVEALKDSIHKAKETAFRKVDPKINKPYITEKTMQLREERQKARDNFDGETEKICTSVCVTQ